MRLALDTNRYVDFCRGDSQAVERIREAERIYLPFVTLAELRAGFLCGTKVRHNERVLTRFLNSPRVRTLYADEQTTHHYARLFLQLREQATPIPTNDIWIAALSIQHDLPLFARDSHFDHLPQLVRL
jgi:tRNA(fMet)-specific endonuclease VapC